MVLAVIDIFSGADFLIYPLGVCSVVMVYIIGERAYALRKNAVMPQDIVDAIANVARNQNDKPLEPVVMNRVYIEELAA